MSERDTSLLLQDILTSIHRILEYTKGIRFEEYDSDVKTRDAVERNFQIIGEASGRLSEFFKQTHAQIEWRIVKDFRNFLIHEYFGVDNAIVWDVIQHDLPRLSDDVQKILASPTEI